MKKNNMKTGKLIEALMHYKHISIEERSQSTGISMGNVTTLLTCRRNITPFLARKFGKVLGIDLIVNMTNRMCEELQKGE
jgi:plasmid maintenance system antidote protein VapI